MNTLLNLNDNQTSAVTAPISPSELTDTLIVACAGSGKTRVVTSRIAYLINHGISPHSILAITFTRKAANSMRDRACQMNSGAKHALLTTFHALCAEILRTYFSEMAFIILDQNDQRSVFKNESKTLQARFPLYDAPLLRDFEEWLNTTRSKCLDPCVEILRKTGLPSMSHVTSFMSNQKDMEQSKIAENANISACSVALLLHAYLEFKGKTYLDFDDLIEKVVELLKSRTDIRQQLIERWTYQFVDEFQDTNQRQFELLSLLRGNSTQRMMVGDEDQSIYGWRGAQIKYILSMYNDVKDNPNGIVMLNDNYRCSKNILTLANAIIAQNNIRIGKESQAIRPNGVPVSYGQFSDEYAESAAIVKKIKQWRQNGIPYNDMGILYRVNAIAGGLERSLIEAKIPYKIYDGFSLFDRVEVRLMLNMLWAASRPNLDLHVEQVFESIKIGIGESQLRQWRMERKSKKEDWLTFLKKVKPGKRVSESLFRSFIDGWDAASFLITSEGDLYRAINAWLSKFDILDIFKEEERESRSQNMETFLELLENFQDECARLDLPVSIESFQEARLLNDSLVDPESEGKIHLMTVHRAKGLEFKVGCLVGLQDKLFPRSVIDDEDLEEERRTAYVAITRFMDELMVSSAGYRRRYPTCVQESSFLQPVLRKMISSGVVSVIA